MTPSFAGRRAFLRWVGSAALAQTGQRLWLKADALDKEPVADSGDRLHQGPDLTGWILALGDALYPLPGELPVTPSDIAMVHHGTYTELQANVSDREIMAHAIAFCRFHDPPPFEFMHHVAYDFRLPFVPVTGDFVLNAQTLEGGFFIWDGPDTRLDYGLAFQWLLNPYMPERGTVRCWSTLDGGRWQGVGYLEPDTNWHRVAMVLDSRHQTTSLLIDGKHYPCQFTATPKPADWGNTVDARLQAEIVSLYPSAEGQGAVHKAWFRNWTWLWEPYSPCRSYLPAVIRQSTHI